VAKYSDLKKVKEAAEALLAWHDGPNMKKIDDILAFHQLRTGRSTLGEGYQHCGGELFDLRRALEACYDQEI
jgi:hypothetical protein